MDQPSAIPAQPVRRHRLCDASVVAALRTDPPPGLRCRSEAELEASLDAVLLTHDPGLDLHVFGYGSLMWDPALDVLGSSVALVPGWHRHFCLRMIFGRGTPEAPGVMLALDHGGSCRGVLYRIAADKVRAELRLLWRREMLAGAYDARWVWAWADGRRVRALTFVAIRRHERYIGTLPVDAVARLVHTGQGRLGNCRSYFDATVQTLQRLGIRDAGIERLRRTVSSADREAGVPTPITPPGAGTRDARRAAPPSR
jgi:cation transport protein ChaC